MLLETDFPSSDKPKYGKSATTNTYLTNTNYINNIDTKIDTREMFLQSYNKMFISEKTVEFFLNFGELLETKEFLDIIFQTKKYDEKRARTNSKVNHEKQYRITGDFWTTEIEKIAFRFILKMKEGIQKEKKIKNIKTYWNTTMTILWGNVYLMEKAYGKAIM